MREALSGHHAPASGAVGLPPRPSAAVSDPQMDRERVTADAGTLTTVFRRQHWWTRQFGFDAAGIDLSVPGEIRVIAAPSRAA